MKQVFSIFHSDIKRLVKQFFALVVAGGLCAIPSLYAWFNIYSNWDPYANTGNIKIAIVNQDDGFLLDGKQENMGEDIVESLRENNKIGWTESTKEDAINGVRSGEFYAAVVIDPLFTKSMVEAFSQGVSEPTIFYYENEKRNAVATKITDTAVSTLKNNINEKYVETLVSSLFEMTEDYKKELDEDTADASPREKVEDLQKNLKTYKNALDIVVNGNQSLGEIFDETEGKVGQAKTTLQNSESKLDAAKNTLQNPPRNYDTYAKNIKDSLVSIESSISNLESLMKEAATSPQAVDFKDKLEEAKKNATDIKKQLETLDGILATLEDMWFIPSADREKISEIRVYIQSMNENLDSIVAELEALGLNPNALADISGNNPVDMVKNTGSMQGLKSALTNAMDAAKGLKGSYDNGLKPNVDDSKERLKSILTDSKAILQSMEITMDSVQQMSDQTATTVETTNQSLKQVQNSLNLAIQKCDRVLTEIDKVENGGLLDTMLSIMDGNPETYGAFFSSLVEVETKEIYPVANYGSGVTPFYSTLAIWVGAMLLTAIFKPHASKKDYPKASNNQLFFGRYLLFFLLGQIQTAIIVGGDIFLLHCQVIHPWLFYLASAVTSFVFTLLIFALAATFGDIGKALGVVLVVIQIAGSGGTFPIELLPDVYRKIYIFFPFPYAINAMRETIGGMYDHNYVMNLLYLLVFAVVALVIGLVIRKPLIGLNHYVEERMEDTRLM